MSSGQDITPGNNDSAAAGAAVYTKSVLTVYDLFVLGFSNRFVWNAPSQLTIDFYNEHVSGNHLDVGVGTGYFLDKCKFPTETPTLLLLDLNPNSLRKTSQRLARYAPVNYVANILEPIEKVITRIDSIALNYLLHCLPGNMLSKGVVFENLKPVLNPNGVVFGTTILGDGVKRNILAKLFMKIYNSRGIFSNTADNSSDLERILKDNFNNYSIQVEGCVAFFTGRD